MQRFRVVIIPLVVILVNSLLWFCLEPVNYYRCTLHEVQNNQDDYDLVIVGQSHGQFAYSPDDLDRATGMKSYNLCRHFVNVSEIPYIVMEANYKNNLKYVIYDIDSTYWLSNENTNYYRGEYIFPAINSPINKIQYLINENISENYRYTLARYIIRGTDDIKKIPDNIRRKISYEYRHYDVNSAFPATDMGDYVGRGYVYGKGLDEDSYNPPLWDTNIVSEKTINSFELLDDYCDKNNIELVVVTAPQPTERVQSSNYAEYNRFFNELCDKYSVTYIDYNLGYEGELTWCDDDFRDGEGHMVGEFAKKYSEDIGRIIRDR